MKLQNFLTTRMNVLQLLMRGVFLQQLRSFFVRKVIRLVLLNSIILLIQQFLGENNMCDYESEWEDNEEEFSAYDVDDDFIYEDDDK